MRIATDRLWMRPLALDDVDAMHRLWTDPGVRRYLWDDEVISRDVAEAVVRGTVESFERHGFGMWAVALAGDDETVGFCGFRHFGDPPEVEILYGFYPEHWGRGFATEAALAMLRHGFEHCGLERVYAGADPPNEASFRVMERCGMTFDKRTEIDGHEAIYYILTRPA